MDSAYSDFVDDIFVSIDWRCALGILCILDFIGLGRSVVCGSRHVTNYESLQLMLSSCSGLYNDMVVCDRTIVPQYTDLRCHLLPNLCSYSDMRNRIF